MLLFQFLDEAFLSRTLLGVSAGVWLSLLALWAVCSAGLLLVRRFAAWRLKAISSRTANRVDDVVVALIEATRSGFLIALSLFLAVWILDLPDAIGEVVSKGFFLAFLVQAVYWGNRAITVSLHTYKESRLEQDAAAVTSMQAVAILGRILLIVFVVLLALDNFGVDVATLIAGLGVGGIAVALAVQNILGDLFASLSIVLDKPFVVGDFLIVGEHLGTVEQIGLKTTRLRSLSGEQIIVSNSDLLKSRIRNYKRMYERRVVFTVGVVYQTPADQLAAIPALLRDAVESQDLVRFDRAHFKQYGDFALVYEVVYFVLSPDYNTYMDIHQEVNLALFRSFEANGIEFAYPTQTLYITAEENGAPRPAVAGS